MSAAYIDVCIYYTTYTNFAWSFLHLAVSVHFWFMFAYSETLQDMALTSLIMVSLAGFFFELLLQIAVTAFSRLAALK